MLVPKGAMIFCGLTHNKLLIAIHPSPRSLDEKELVMNTAVWDALIASFCMRLFGCKSIEAVQNHGDFWVFAGVIYIYINMFNSMRMLKTAVCGSPVTNHDSKVFLHNPATSKSNETSKASQIARVSQCFGPVSAPTRFFPIQSFRRTAKQFLSIGSCWIRCSKI